MAKSFLLFFDCCTQLLRGVPIIQHFWTCTVDMDGGGRRARHHFFRQLAAANSQLSQGFNFFSFWLKKHDVPQNRYQIMRHAHTENVYEGPVEGREYLQLLWVKWQYNLVMSSQVCIIWHPCIYQTQPLCVVSSMELLLLLENFVILLKPMRSAMSKIFPQDWGWRAWFFYNRLSEWKLYLFTYLHKK